MRKFTLLILTANLLFGCLPKESSVSVNFNKVKSATQKSSINSASVSSVQVINNQLVINGNGFSDVTNVKVNGNSLNESFTIESKTATKIIVNSIRAFSFDVSKVFSLILSDANASATFAIDFSLCNATLNGKGFNCAAPVADKDVLAYDAVSGTWKPRPASGLNYLGTFDASSNPGAGPAIQPAGAYYVISDDGNIGVVNFSVGDWLVSNGSTWQKIDNSSAVLSVHGRYGAITAQHGDYTLDLLGDVSFPTAPVVGKVLKFDGTNWVAGDDLSGGGAGSVTTTAIANAAVTDAKIDTVSASKITGTITSAQIADGSIMNADINAAAAIDYSKLNIANGEIPAAKISGLPVLSTILAATITNGDSTHAPTGDAIYDALALKLGTNGGILTTGTISGLPTPVGPSEAANKSYVDSAIASVTGFTEAAVLGTDLAGLNTGVNGPITSADTVLGAFGKMQYQVTDLKSKGLWDKTANDIAYSAGNVSIDKKLRLKSDNTNYVEILSPTSLAATYTLTLPPNDGNADQVLKTNGTGTLSWADLTDTGVQAFAKAALPTCGASEVLKSNGVAFSCVTDTSVPAFTGTANRVVATTGAGGALAVQAVTSTELGYLTGVTSAIQTQLNGKEGTLTAGTSAQYYRGDKTWATLNTAGVPELTNLYFTQARAIASPLTGVSSTAGTITAADTILGAFGKLLNTQTDYVSKTANSTITGTLTINSIVGALKVPPPVNVDDAVPKSYVDGFGQWTKSGADLYRDGGFVGIGTTTPTVPLEVKSSTSVNVAKFTGNPTGLNQEVVFVLENLNNTAPANSNKDLVMIHASKLKNDGNSGGAAIITLGDNYSGNYGFPGEGIITSSNYTTGMYLNNRSLTGDMRFGNNSSEHMRIARTNGYVGIGTTTPTSKLSVSDGGTPAPYVSADKLAVIGSANTVLQVTSPNTAASALYFSDPDSRDPGGISYSHLNDQMSFRTANAFRMFISNNGNVGIGTSSPATKLHVTGTSTATANNLKYLLNLTDDTAFNTAVGGGVMFSGKHDSAGTVGGFGLIYGGKENAIEDDTAGYVSLATVPNAGGVTERLRITSTGNIGIGTSTPSSALNIVNNSTASDASDDFNIHTYSATTTPGVILTRGRGTEASPTSILLNDILGGMHFRGWATTGSVGSGASIQAAAESNWAAGVNPTTLKFLTNSGNSIVERMRISGNGNVGIGTSTPLAPLHISTTLSGSSVAMIMNGDTEIGMTDGEDFEITHVDATGAITNRRFVINNAGSVGIATTNPLATLDVNGGIRIKGGTNPGAGTSGLSFSSPGDNDSGINSPADGIMTFWSNNGEAMRIAVGGNLGIGTTNPTTKLQVNGTIAPATDNTSDLGTAAIRFRNTYLVNAPTVTSDARLKLDIKNTDLGLDFINKLRPVSYYWKDGSDQELHYGLIAQETKKALRDSKKTNELDNVIVTHDKQTDRYGVRYTELISPLIKAIQELYRDLMGVKALYARIVGIEKHVEVLDRQVASKADKAEIAALKLKNEKLQKENSDIKAYLCSKDPNAVICK